MSENTRVEQNRESSFGNTLVNIGAEIKKHSDHEVPNKQVIAGLAIIGVAGVCATVGASVHGDKMIELSQVLEKFAETAINSNHHAAAVGFLTEAITAREAAADAFTLSAVNSFVLASEVAVIGGVEVAKSFANGEGLLDVNGKTKISTIGSAFGGLLIKVGNHFNKK